MSDDRTSHAIDERYSAVCDSAVELVDPPLTPSNDPDSGVLVITGFPLGSARYYLVFS